MSEIDSMPGKLDALGLRVGSIEHALGDFGRALEDNTTLTRGIARQMEAIAPKVEEMHGVYAPVKTTGSLLSKVIRWAGGIGAAIAGIWAAMHLGGGGK